MQFLVLLLTGIRGQSTTVPVLSTTQAPVATVSSVVSSSTLISSTAIPTATLVNVSSTISTTEATATNTQGANHKADSDTNPNSNVSFEQPEGPIIDVPKDADINQRNTSNASQAIIFSMLVVGVCIVLSALGIAAFKVYVRQKAKQDYWTLSSASRDITRDAFDIQFTPRRSSTRYPYSLDRNRNFVDKPHIYASESRASKYSRPSDLETEFKPGDFVFDSSGYAYRVAQDGYAYLIPPTSYEQVPVYDGDLSTLSRRFSCVSELPTFEVGPLPFEESELSLVEMESNLFQEANDRGVSPDEIATDIPALELRSQSNENDCETLLRNESHVYQSSSSSQ